MPEKELKGHEMYGKTHEGNAENRITAMKHDRRHVHFGFINCIPIRKHPETCTTMPAMRR